ncbi:efflux RND transporter periplasmic adaptor subunit [Thalassotalea euphylliae]|nr:hypothetical protein [Thalassotalea euphylliae]
MRKALPLVAALGILLTVAIVKLQPEMQHNPQAQLVTPVNVVEIEQHKVKPNLVGFGTVKPDIKLNAIAEVSGRITYVHPELKKGAFIAKDTLVLSIDDKDYKLAIQQVQADLLAAQENVKELELTIENNKLELKLANQQLKVSQSELERLSTLRKNGTVSQSRLDQETKAVLAQRQEVQKLESQRTTLPSELAVLHTKIDIAKAKLEQAERDLSRTQIYLPFNGRIAEVSSEKDQFVSLGSKLFSAVGIDKITINAQFPIDQFSQFIAETDRDQLDLTNMTQLPVMSEVLAQMGLTAQVEVAGEQFKGWQAKVERLSDSLDLKTRTVGVIVSVQGSYLQVEPGIRPPLLEGMYMKVTLKGKPKEFLVLPRFAIKNQQIYKVTAQNTLARLAVENALLQGNLALLLPNKQLTEENADEQLLKAGDKILVSDVFPAVNGMALKPVQDTATQNQLRAWLERTQ